MRNWHPFLADTLAEMSRAGVRRAVGLIAAAHRSYSSCLQYQENVRDARAALREQGLADVEVTYVGDWHDHPGFIEASAAQVEEAIAKLPDAERAPRHAGVHRAQHSVRAWPRAIRIRSSTRRPRG